MFVAVVDEDRGKPSEQGWSQHDVIWNFVPGHVAHLNLKSARRSRHDNGLLCAGGEMQLNGVFRVTNGWLFDHRCSVQTVIAVKVQEIVSNFGVSVRCGNCRLRGGGEAEAFISAVRGAARNG